MPLPQPHLLFDRLAARFPGVPVASLSATAFVALLAATAVVAFHHPWAGAPLLLAALIAGGWGQTEAQRQAQSVSTALPLGLLMVPFGFGLADPTHALAAMFLMLSLAVFTTQRALAAQWGIRWMHGLAGAGLAIACLLPDHFSLLAYLVGIGCFISAGQGQAQR